MLDVGCWGQKAGWQVHAYGLMRNHYPVVLETPNANLVAGRACSRRRRRAGWRRRRPGRGFAGAGVWAARSSSARCWRRWKAGSASPIRTSCAASRPKRRRSIIGEKLSRLGWSWAELAARHKSGPGKLALPAGLRQETTHSLKGSPVWSEPFGETIASKSEARNPRPRAIRASAFDLRASDLTHVAINRSLLSELSARSHLPPDARLLPSLLLGRRGLGRGSFKSEVRGPKEGRVPKSEGLHQALEIHATRLVSDRVFTILP